MHCRPVPRVGGLAIVAGLLVGGLVVIPGTSSDDSFRRLFDLIALAAVPAFFAGLIEDVTKRVGVLTRMLATIASGALFALLSGIWLKRLDLPFIDSLLLIAVIGIAVTAFAVAGVANAINIIDGFNGLAGGVSLIILLGMAAIAHQVGDHTIMQLALLGAAALVGFLAVNFPRGAIFLGDGGSYLIGYYMAQLAVLLVVRNPEVSAWAMAVLFCYPLAETTFSILRRVRNKRHPGHPDRIHLHSLIHGRIVKRFAQPNTPSWLSNALVAPFGWVLAAAPALAAIQWYQNTTVLMLCAAVYCLVYNALYARLAIFRWCIACLFGFGLPAARANRQITDPEESVLPPGAP